MPKTRILVVDDSALMRQLLTKILNQEPDFDVVGSARDPYDAWEKIKNLKPDVLTLDVEMPRMDGVAFLEKLMSSRPIPVVMVSTLTEKGCQTTLRALEVGAVDFVSKPKLDVQAGTFGMAQEIIHKVKTAAIARPRRYVQRAKSRPKISSGVLIQCTHKVIAIGASTGGTEALKELLMELPADSPGLVIVQHMPGSFTQSFAERLDRKCRIQVREARDGDRILPGLALLAPGGRHMEVRRVGATYDVRITDTPPVNRFRPSVDVLLHSCAQHFGKHAVGVMLTGMGCDGAKGMKAMYDTGAFTVAQNEETCVVFGMPKAAIAEGGVSEILPLENIVPRIAKSLSMRTTPARSSRCASAR